MSDTTQLIKEKLDIVDFLRQYIELKPAGKNFKACCPFHKEKTPSFMVSPERQTWHCFGACSEGGDVIKFLMKYENLEFYDALKILAEKAGIDIQKTGTRDFKEHNILYSITEAAKNFFKSNLGSSESAKKYLIDRGLSKETIDEFELGLALDNPDALMRHLLKAGYRINDIERAGLAIKTERGTYWDRFRSRLMFPLYNHFGKVIAFTGRVLPLPESSAQGLVVAKYINSPETSIFQKSKVLYGFHKTKNDIRELKSVVLAEGQMDFLMMWQDGIKNAVATSGTALTADQLKLLRRLADELILGFDSDEAGQAAAERSIDAANALDFSVKILTIDQENLKDPADIVKENPGQMKILIEKAKPAMDYYFYKYLSKFFPDMEAALKNEKKKLKENIRIILTKIKKLSSQIERSNWLKELATRTNYDEKVLLEELEMIQEEKNVVLAFDLVPKTPQGAENQNKKDLISRRLLALAASHQELKESLDKEKDYLPEYYKQVYEGSTVGDLDKLADLVGLNVAASVAGVNEDKLKNEFQNLLKQLKIESLKEKRQEVSRLVKQLENGNNTQQLAEALKEFDTISQELHNLSK